MVWGLWGQIIMADVENCPIYSARLRTITTNSSVIGRACSMRAVVRKNVAVRLRNWRSNGIRN